MADITQERAPYTIRRFCEFVNTTPPELLEWQRRCFRSQELPEKREVLHRVHAFLDSQDGTKAYKERELVDLYSFFDFHDMPLPNDRGYRVRATRPQNVGSMTRENLTAILTAAHVTCDYAMHSMIWSQFLSFSGVAEICYINTQSSPEIVPQLEAEKNPIKINMLRIRKGNERPWFTYIGAPGANALREYFDKQRGWPGKGEPIWLDKAGGCMTPKSYAYKFLSLSRHVKIVPKLSDIKTHRGIRYGKSPHELRDLARSLVHEAHSEQHTIEGKTLLFDAACPEFWMGHTAKIDPLKYNEFWKHNPEGVRRQYRIAEKYLNITSNPQISNADLKRRDQELTQLREKYDRLEEMVTRISSGEFTAPTVKSWKDPT